MRDSAFSSGGGSRPADLIGDCGIVVGATVRVNRLPEAIAARAWMFPDFESGAAAIREAVQNGVPAAMLRLCDEEETRFERIVNQGCHAPSPVDRSVGFLLTSRGYAKPCRLIAEFEGTRTLVLAAKNAFGRIARAHGGLPLGRGPAERWQHRRFQASCLRDPMLDRGLGVGTLKTACRWSDLPKVYPAVKRALEGAIRETVPRAGARGIVLCHTGHSSTAGASLHFTCVFPRALDNELAQWEGIQHAAQDAIVAHGGIYAEEDHPLPMRPEVGGLENELLRGIKQMFDPKGILNPGR